MQKVPSGYNLLTLYSIIYYVLTSKLGVKNLSTPKATLQMPIYIYIWTVEAKFSQCPPTVPAEIKRVAISYIIRPN